MKKRFSALLLAALMAVGTLSGCGGSSSSGSAAPAASGASSGAEEWPATTIQYVNINSESMGGPQVQEMVKKFNETNGKNITVEVNFVSAN